MRNNLKLSFIIGLFFCVSFLSAQELTLKIMSFNIQQPYGTNWDARKSNAALIINSESPDVIGTQEAVNYQRNYLIAETGYSWYGTGRDGGDAGEGSWVFYKSSKYTLDESNSGSFWMSATPNIPSRFGGAYNRICTYVRLVDKGTGQGFYVYNAHFPTPDLYPERLQSMKMLADRMSTRNILTDPVYLTGDFNSNEGDVVTVWMKTGQDNPIQCRDTYRDVDPNGSVNTGFGTKFDYIYCPNSSKYTTISSQVIATPEASDHRPIVAVVNFSGVVVVPDPIVIPGKLEAEDYFLQSGVQLEDTDDEGEGENVGFIDADDWMKYAIDVTTSGNYNLDIRSAGESLEGEIEVYIDDMLKQTVTLKPTDGWQVWDNTLATIELTAGEHELKLQVVKGGFNLNWIDFSESITNESFQVKIVSANLWRKSNDWATRKGNVVSLISAELPDVVGIQEGDEGKQGELDLDLLNYKLETGPWDDQSTAIMYHSGKVKVVETGVFGFSSQPDNKSVSDWGDGAANGWLRVCNWVLFEQLSTGSKFYVYNTHLDANGFTPNAGEWRSMETRLIAERIASRSFVEYPFVLVGDLNGVENEEAITYLKSGTENTVKMKDTYRVSLPNGPGDSFGSVKYDYIMVEDKASNQVVDADIIYHSQYGWTSDHNQVFATINFLDNDVSAPVISLVEIQPAQPVSGESITVSATVESDTPLTSVVLNWGYDMNTLSNSELMSATGDDFEATISGQNDKTSVYYQIEAKNEDGIIEKSKVYSVFVSDEVFGLYADYDAVDISFSGFGGSDFNEVENPFKNSGNMSDRVAATVQGLEAWAGVYSEVLQSINFTNTPILKMKVYGPKPSDILIKFEDELDGDEYYELTALLPNGNQWTEIEVDFSDAPSGVFEKIVLFFDYGNGVEDTYYFDDVRLESKITNTEERVLGSSILMSPNPASDHVYFSQICKWNIYTVTGQKVKGGMSESVDVSALTTGVYLIQIEGSVQRLIIE